MQEYLVAFTLVHANGHSSSRSFKKLPLGQIVDKNTILRWENEIETEYVNARLMHLTIHVLSFQTL